jgi:phage baseplate assembly protein V
MKTSFEDGQGNAAHRILITKVNDAGDQQLLDIDGLSGEQTTEVLRAMPHGLASNPPPESEAIVFGLAHRDMPVVLGGESPKHRPRNLPVGAVMLYDTNDGRVYLDASGNLFADVKKKATVTAGEEAVVKAPKIKLDGNVEITGTLKVAGDVETGADMRTAGVHTDRAGGHG